MPKTYIELDPEAARAMLQGYSDELTGERRKLDSFYAQFRCPRCGGPCEKHFLGVEHANQPDSGWLIQRSGLKCRLCDCVFDPHTAGPTGNVLIVELGNPGKINERMHGGQTPWAGDFSEIEKKQ